MIAKPTEGYAPTPMSMAFAVWYRRVYLWGLALAFLPASIQAYLATASDWAGPMPQSRLIVLVGIMAVLWAIAAVFVTLLALGVLWLIDRIAPGPGPEAPPEALLAERFARWYPRIYLWAPGLFFFFLTVRMFLVERAVFFSDGYLGPLVLVIMLATAWAVLAVPVTFALIGVKRAMARGRAQ